MVSPDRRVGQALRIVFHYLFSLLNIIKIIDQYFRVAQISSIHYSNCTPVYVLNLNCHYYPLTTINEQLTFDNDH